MSLMKGFHLIWHLCRTAQLTGCAGGMDDITAQLEDGVPHD